MKKPENKKVSIKFKPASDRVLVKPEAAGDEKTVSGIIIPDTARKEKPERGIIVAVGPGKRGDDGKVTPIAFKVGDKVMFAKYSEQEITLGDEEYYIIKESDIVGTF